MNRLRKTEPKANGHASAPRCGTKPKAETAVTLTADRDDHAATSSLANVAPNHMETEAFLSPPPSPSTERGSKPARRGFSSVCPKSANVEEKPASADVERAEGFSSVCPESANVAEKPAGATVEQAEGFSSVCPESAEVEENPFATAAESESRKNVGGRPPVLDDYARGKLVISLAVGLSQRQAAGWLGCDQKTVSLALNSDPRIAADLAWHASVARLHPFLKIYNEAAGNWKASAWLLEYLEKRHGKLTVDDLMRMLMEVWGMTRALMPPEISLDLTYCMKEDWQSR